MRSKFDLLRTWWRWLRIWLAGRPARNIPQVFYGHDHIPSAQEAAYGGMVKFQRMQTLFPNVPRRFNLLYLVSSWRPKDGPQLLWLARRKGAKFVWNQNGVGYPAWSPEKWEKINTPMAALLHAADYVFYQSQFCKRSADHFLGPRQDRYEILYNAVDTTIFTPAVQDPAPQQLVLLLGGNQYQWYRLEAALQTVALVARQHPNIRLLVTGKLGWTTDANEAECTVQQCLYDLNIAEHVQFLGPYNQQDAPTILRQAHILLHTKYNDPCPGLVIEAMACGLPVVYSASGGVPELVGQEAGIGIPAELSWEQDFPPDPERLVEAVLQVAERRKVFAEAARQQALSKFDLQPWLQRHRQVFEELIRK